MAGMSNSLIDKVLNATTGTGTGGAPGTFAAYDAGAMKVKLTSTASSAAASGTELTGTGYTAGGQALSEAADAASGGGPVTMPKTTPLSWTNGSGGAWSIVSFELTDNAGVRTWWGEFTGQPITVSDGNTFEIAVDGISIDLS